ncbi:MFS general substrate transporter [Schizophyllum commune H4-8]|uniref:Major facilitator superfamily (MFS) profile domain-containing protein n=1 Tax=Schizophyllum commune (strain H4-8 / FGSC 9210) TaxID=578458 RepID=D8PJX2_SCHCM|nr:MFS general substrate transporter [Schizophyllum commune H4-8]KAI5894026.1 MFS general substrate transporter [Schizophyllum commune H4-8]
MAATSKDAQVYEHRVEDIEKDIGSITSSEVQPAAGIDAEVAEFFATQSDGHIVIDEATNKRLRMMIHKRVLVVMVVTYFAQTLDKGTINFASIMGIVQDTHLVGQQYSWLTTCVYIAVLIWEFPTNRLIQRLPIAKYLSFNIAAWGAVLACTAVCHNFTGLVIVRTLLGVFECVCQPAFVFLSTMWYTREEQALVIGAFYSMNGFQQCVGGLIAYGISQIQGAAIKNWQILFLLLGCATFVWGLFVGFWLPDSPMRAKCFSKEDRVLMAERVRKNETGIQNKEFKWYQVREALTDPVVLSVTLISFTNGMPTGGLGAFSNIIIQAFGFTMLQTYLLAIAQGAIIMTFLFSGAYLSKKYNQKIILAIIYTLPNIIGTIVFLIVPTRADTKVGLLISFYLTMAFGAVSVLNLAVMSNNVAGRTKQVMASSLVFIAWAVGNAVGPQVFRDNDKPRYINAFIAHMVVYVLQIVVLVFLRAYLMRQNVLKRRAAALRESAANGEAPDEQLGHTHAFDDLTDKENPDFRYTY